MPSTTRDPLTEATASSGSTKNEVPGLQPGGATGAEIPVTVHASRYSAASKGAAKLPPVHEETCTVIVLPQGAVVRLSATVSAGELVVLTNKNTGADVICRVTSVKTQPGIQNYVHLEFTQRAPDFWEEASTAGRSASMGRPAAAVPREGPVGPTPVPAGTTRPSSSVQGALRGKESTPSVEAKSVPAASPKIIPLADLPSADSEKTAARPSASQSQDSEILSSPVLAQKQPPDLPHRTPRLQPFEAVMPQRKKTSKIVFFATAAAALLAIGAVGGAIRLRWERGTIVIPQFSHLPATSAAPPLPATSTSDAPILSPSGKPSSPELPASVLAKSSPAETPLAQPAAPVPAVVEPPKTDAQPQPVNRLTINVGKMRAPKVKKAAQLNASEPPPVLSSLSSEVNALPSMIGETLGNGTASASPPPPAPVKGGQLQQPKLVSSAAAVYPPLARAQRVQGDVVIDTLIDANGKVAATNVISGNPLLQKAAIDSLRLWKYQPALLNGVPIPIHINVTVTFHLN